MIAYMWNRMTSELIFVTKEKMIVLQFYFPQIPFNLKSRQKSQVSLLYKGPGIKTLYAYFSNLC